MDEDSLEKVLQNLAQDAEKQLFQGWHFDAALAEGVRRRIAARAAIPPHGGERPWTGLVFGGRFRKGTAAALTGVFLLLAAGLGLWLHGGTGKVKSRAVALRSSQNKENLHGLGSSAGKPAAVVGAKMKEGRFFQVAVKHTGGMGAGKATGPAPGENKSFPGVNKAVFLPNATGGVSPQTAVLTTPGQVAAGDGTSQEDRGTVRQPFVATVKIERQNFYFGDNIDATIEISNPTGQPITLRFQPEYEIRTAAGGQTVFSQQAEEQKILLAPGQSWQQHVSFRVDFAPGNYVIWMRGLPAGTGGDGQTASPGDLFMAQSTSFTVKPAATDFLQKTVDLTDFYVAKGSDITVALERINFSSTATAVYFKVSGSAVNGTSKPPALLWTIQRQDGPEKAQNCTYKALSSDGGNSPLEGAVFFNPTPRDAANMILNLQIPLKSPESWTFAIPII